MGTSGKLQEAAAQEPDEPVLEVVGGNLRTSTKVVRKISHVAAVAQLVERELPKLEVTGSRPARRS